MEQKLSFRTELQTSRWADRFLIAAVIQGALAAALTSYLLYQGVYGSPAASRIVANLGGAGNAGIWLTIGYLLYLPLGPIAAAVTTLFYRHIEAHMQKPYTGFANVLAWIHLILMNVGVVGATWLMMNAGYRGGALAMTLAQQNPSLSQGAISGMVHTQVMAVYPPYIVVFVALAIVGAIAGGLGYVITWRWSGKSNLRQ